MAGSIRVVVTGSGVHEQDEQGSGATARAAPVTLAGHAHLDLAWGWGPREARIEALDTARSAVELLSAHDSATFVMSQAVVYQWLTEADPGLMARIRELVGAGRWEPVGGWWVEADLFGASPASIHRQAALGQRTFEQLVGRRCTVGFSPDTFGHPSWLPGVLRDAGLTTYVITRPSHAESGLPACFVWEGDDGARVTVVRAEQYSGVPTLDPSGLCLYGVGNHGGGPTRAHLAAADELCAGGFARHGSIASFAEQIDVGALPIIRGDLVHHARGCYATLVSFKERMRALECRLLQHRTPLDSWEPLLFWQFHDVLAGTSVTDVYDEASVDLARIARELDAPVPGPATVPTIIPRQRVDEGRPVIARETLGESWCGWVDAVWTSSQLAQDVVVDGCDAVLRRVEQHGIAWRLHVLVHLTLAPHEERELRWAPVPGRPGALDPPPAGVRLAVVEDGTDTWGHSLVSYGAEVAPSPASELFCAGGPDGLVEAAGTWLERDRALKLVIPIALLDPEHVSRVAREEGEMPGGEWTGPVWGRVWSYDTTADALRVTLRRSPPYALHDPMPRLSHVDRTYTDQGFFTARLWLRPQPARVPPLLVTL